MTNLIGRANKNRVSMREKSDTNLLWAKVDGLMLSPGLPDLSTRPAGSLSFH